MNNCLENNMEIRVINIVLFESLCRVAIIRNVSLQSSNGKCWFKKKYSRKKRKKNYMFYLYV